MAADPILELDGVEAGYGHAALVLRGLSVAVHPGELVCLVGPNGAGKSTVLRVASGLLAPRAGAVRLRGEEVGGVAAEKLLPRGLVHVLQGHSVFPEMTVAENVLLGAFTLRDKALVRARAEAVRDRYQVVAERWSGLAGLLSGGQQKMVEFARAMMLDPDVILLDEPSCGLDPRSSAQVFAEVGKLRDAGKAVLLVEQNARSGLEIADRGCVLDLGVVRMEGPAAALLHDPQLASLYLGGAPPPAPTGGAPSDARGGAAPSHAVGDAPPSDATGGAAPSDAVRDAPPSDAVGGAGPSDAVGDAPPSDAVGGAGPSDAVGDAPPSDAVGGAAARTAPVPRP